jgi:ribosomal protein L21E
MNLKKLILSAVVAILPFNLCAQDTQKKGYCLAVKADEEFNINGSGGEVFWQRAQWYAIDELYLGKAKESFSGRFKVAWRGNQIYLLAEITDDNLTNSLAAGFENYWQGDYVEIFIDEAMRKTKHYKNNKAFAYHVMHTGEVVDIDTDGKPKVFPDSVKFSLESNGSRHLWKMVVNVYSKKYSPEAKGNSKYLVKLKKGKKLGFTVAYGDNNGSGREAFYGSTPGQGDTGYITSEKFGVLELAE